MAKILKYASIGAAGWILGAFSYPKFTSNADVITSNNAFKYFSNIPLFQTVLAATPISSVVIPPQPPDNATCTAQIMRFGFPSYVNIRSYEDHVLAYDNRNRIAYWVFEHLSHDKLENKADRSLCTFKSDNSVHEYFRATNADYKGSGYDRGHLAAAGNHGKSQSSCEQTFLLSNIAPQVGEGFNRDSWNRLEKYVRSLTRKYKNVYVCSGPLFLPWKRLDGKQFVTYEVIGDNQVAVPTHFFKIVVAETKFGELDMECYVMPNAVISNDEPLSNFLVPPESVERSSGLLFYDKVARQKIRSINKS